MIDTSSPFRNKRTKSQRIFMLYMLLKTQIIPTVICCPRFTNWPGRSNAESQSLQRYAHDIHTVLHLLAHWDILQPVTRNYAAHRQRILYVAITKGWPAGLYYDQQGPDEYLDVSPEFWTASPSDESGPAEDQPSSGQILHSPSQREDNLTSTQEEICHQQDRLHLVPSCQNTYGQISKLKILIYFYCGIITSEPSHMNA
jgi:hypothetical protein